MKVSIVRGNELASDLLRPWREIQLANPELGSPYFSPEFTQAVASVSDDVEVAVIEEDNKVSALLPFERRGAVGMPVGRTLSDYHGLICAAGIALDPRELIEKCRLIAWDFDHLLASQDCFSPFHWTHDESPQINLSRGFDAYTSECHAARSEQIKMRRLERELGALHFVAHASNSVALEQTLAWKVEQGIKQGGTYELRHGRPRAIIESIFDTQSENFAGMLSLLYAGDRLVAAQFGMRSRTDWHWWFPSYDPAMAKYSPGLILLLKMAKHAPSVGLLRIDLGKGRMHYKERFKNTSIRLAIGSIALPSLRNYRRAALHHLKRQVLASPLAPSAKAAARTLRQLGQRHLRNRCSAST